MKKTEILILLATILFLVAYVAPVLAADEVNPCRYTDPKGWKFQFVKQFNPADVQEKIEILRSVGMIPPMLEMIVKSEDKYDWLQCGIMVPENMSLVIGPETKVLIKKDSVEIVSIKLVFTDRLGRQYWDSQYGQIPLGLSEHTGIYAKSGEVTPDRGKTKLRVISYGVFVAMPKHSGITKSSIKEVKLTGVGVEESRQELKR
jgi:hypothetical protein